MPILTPVELISHYNDDPDHFEHVLTYLFEPALRRAGYDTVRPSVLNSGVIQAEIIRNLETADLVLCDISTWNANVFFEYGIRVALDRPAALVKDTKTPTIPFDNALVSCHTYDASITPWQLDSEIGKLASFVQSAGAQDRNALWRYFGITQRASIPAGTDDPVQAKLDLLLARVELLSNPTSSISPSRVSGTYVSPVGRAVAQILGVPIAWSGELGNVTFLNIATNSTPGDHFQLTEKQKRELIHLAESLGVSIVIRGRSGEIIFTVLDSDSAWLEDALLRDVNT